MPRRTSLPVGVIALTAAVLMLVAWPVAVVAQAEGSPAPPGDVGLPSDVCILASTDELSAIDPGVTLTFAIPTPGACNYGSPPDRPFAGAYLTVSAMPVSLLDVSIAGDVRDVTVAGSSGRVGSRDVIVAVGPWLLRINGTIPAPDPGAWLIDAAAIAVPRLAALGAADAGPICARLGAAATQGILGVAIGRVVGDAGSCSWSTGDEFADLPTYVNVEARVEIGDLATAGLALTDFEEVDVAGRRGLWVPSAQRLVVESGSGGLVTIRFLVAPEEIATRDHAIALAAALFEAGAA